ncbi:expressed unknown protein [Seminavis robusta]|uniref:Uncharacterized protein n=1 Tax=Seminavis robusta TaxID=568900 RepID=A0A9N8EU29_9STRA|nr:expressed unknown protein [Seminavis robusta]|eukprot:Sro1573_g283450.1 n/a (214) ;mRNA; r:13056-13697
MASTLFMILGSPPGSSSFRVMVPYLRPHSRGTITQKQSTTTRSPLTHLHMTTSKDTNIDTDEEKSSSSLGIDIGRQLDFLGTDAERESLKAELAAIINTTVANGLVDLTKLKEKWHRDLETGEALSRVEQAMNKNGATQTKLLQYRVDKLIDEFLDDTLASRSKTHLLAYEDAARLRKLEAEANAKQARAKNGPKVESWSKTNDAWDREWDDW